MAGTDLGQIKTHPNVDLIAVAEVDPDRRRQAQARLKGAKVYSDWREMLDEEGEKNLILLMYQHLTTFMLVWECLQCN